MNHFYEAGQCLPVLVSCTADKSKFKIKVKHKSTVLSSDKATTIMFFLWRLHFDRVTLLKTTKVILKHKKRFSSAVLV